jgi:hypothetical protein
MCHFLDLNDMSLDMSIDLVQKEKEKEKKKKKKKERKMVQFGRISDLRVMT